MLKQGAGVTEEELSIRRAWVIGETNWAKQNQLIGIQLTTHNREIWHFILKLAMDVFDQTHRKRSKG